MKRFHFSLQSLSVVRSARDRQARERFSAAVQAVIAAEEALATMRLEKTEFERVVMAQRAQHFYGGEQAAFWEAHRRLVVRETEHVNALREAETAREARRVEWMAARRDLRLIERLEEKARAEHRLAEAREFQQQLDDRTGALAARSAA